MGFFSGVTNAISSVIGGATKAASKWGGTAVKAYAAAKSGNILSLIGTVGSSLMAKKAGGSGEWSPTDTSSGITIPKTGSFAMGFKKAGSGEAPNQRMKTVDADTLNAEWEYRLEKGFRKKNLFT
jgi:hypothetical protein